MLLILMLILGMILGVLRLVLLFVYCPGHQFGKCSQKVKLCLTIEDSNRLHVCRIRVNVVLLVTECVLHAIVNKCMYVLMHLQ